MWTELNWTAWNRTFAVNFWSSPDDVHRYPYRLLLSRRAGDKLFRILRAIESKTQMQLRLDRFTFTFVKHLSVNTPAFLVSCLPKCGLSIVVFIVSLNDRSSYYNNKCIRLFGPRTLEPTRTLAVSLLPLMTVWVYTQDGTPLCPDRHYSPTYACTLPLDADTSVLQ